MGVTRCWVLRDRAPFTVDWPSWLVGGGGCLVALVGALVVSIPLQLPVGGCGFGGDCELGLACLFFENCTVDASIFVALSF